MHPLPNNELRTSHPRSALVRQSHIIMRLRALCIMNPNRAVGLSGCLHWSYQNEIRQSGSHIEVDFLLTSSPIPSFPPFIAVPSSPTPIVRNSKQGKPN
jgi:hypothetical protein